MSILDDIFVFVYKRLKLFDTSILNDSFVFVYKRFIATSVNSDSTFGKTKWGKIRSVHEKKKSRKKKKRKLNLSFHEDL